MREHLLNVAIAKAHAACIVLLHGNCRMTDAKVGLSCPIHLIVLAFEPRACIARHFVAVESVRHEQFLCAHHHLRCCIRERIFALHERRSIHEVAQARAFFDRERIDAHMRHPKRKSLFDRRAK